MEDISITGRKTFFIAPVKQLLPESTLERLLSHGYESYCILDDGTCPMQKKIEDIIELYPGAIIFLNIDSAIPGIDWKAFTTHICQKYRANAKIGVIYQERLSGAEEAQIEGFYRQEAKVTCGCLPLTANHTENYERVLAALSNAGARGRREKVRAYCDSSSTAIFNLNGQLVQGSLKDINRIHFCCTFPERHDEIKIYEQLHDVALNLNGFKFNADVVMIMKHSRDGINKYIFMFVKRDGSPELEEATRRKLNKKIYSIVTEERWAILSKKFEERA